MNRIGRSDEAVCPRCEEEKTPDHIVLRFEKIKRISDVKRRGRSGSERRE